MFVGYPNIEWITAHQKLIKVQLYKMEINTKIIFFVEATREILRIEINVRLGANSSFSSFE